MLLWGRCIVELYVYQGFCVGLLHETSPQTVNGSRKQTCSDDVFFLIPFFQMGKFRSWNFTKW